MQQQIKVLVKEKIFFVLFYVNSLPVRHICSPRRWALIAWQSSIIHKQTFLFIDNDLFSLHNTIKRSEKIENR